MTHSNGFTRREALRTAVAAAAPGATICSGAPTVIASSQPFPHEPRLKRRRPSGIA